jgi:hypothetical protein
VSLDNREGNEPLQKYNININWVEVQTRVDNEMFLSVAGKGS